MKGIEDGLSISEYFVSQLILIGKAMLNKDYCDYDTCVALKELGFNDVIHYNFNKDGVRTPRIPLYEAQKWLREEKKIEVLALSKGMVGAPYDAQVYTEDYVIQEGIEYNSYEEALLEGIKEAVKILKKE